MFDIRGIRVDLADINQRLCIRDNQDLLEWICPLNIPHWKSYDEALQKKYPGTGTWLLSAAESKRGSDK